MNKTMLPILLATLAIATAGALAGWLHARGALQESRLQLLAGTLTPISALLKDNEAILRELQTEPLTEKDAGILPAYLAIIRRDGVAKHAKMKQMLDQLAENNAAIVTLIKAYTPHAKTPAFGTEGDKFRNYAAAWRDRWNSVMELFMAGGNYPAAEVPFPARFPDAVQAEIAAAR
jgi:hypothetical protein